MVRLFLATLTLLAHVSGLILLDVENHGEAWYVYPVTNRRVFLGRPQDAFDIMRYLGLGITDANLATEHYPFKFTPSELMRTRRELRYHSELNWDYDRFTYESLSPVEVRRDLSSLAGFIADEFVPWARSISPTAAREQLRKFGSQRWDEKIWIEDYDRHIQSNGG